MDPQIKSEGDKGDMPNYIGLTITKGLRKITLC